MAETLQIAVIADDLTGAADTGVQFCPTVGPVLLRSSRLAAGPHPPAVGGLALYTDTRHAPAARAARLVADAAAEIDRLGCRRVYKKIDSCLRGNLGVELDALLDALGAAATFAAPAFPAQGRITVDDRHLVGGVPLADSEAGRDPLNPITESRLSRLLQNGSRQPVAHVPLARLTGGSAALADHVRALLAGGCRHIAFDAATDEHLDTVAAAALTLGPAILPVGSAGLAAALARALGAGRPPRDTGERPRVARWLFVCGSGSRVTAEQVRRLTDSGHVSRTVVDPEGVATGRLLTPPGRRGHLLALPALGDAPAATDPGRAVAGLARAAADLLTATRFDALLLTGGDTAEAVVRALGARAVLLHAQIMTGLARGCLVGGPYDGLPVVTKAGAFGNPTTLLELTAALR